MNENTRPLKFKRFQEMLFHWIKKKKKKKKKKNMQS